MNTNITQAAEALINAIYSIQDWNGTYVGECIDALEQAIYAPSVSPADGTGEMPVDEGTAIQKLAPLP